MSRHVVRYEGEGAHRRPVYADEGPSAASSGDGLAGAGRLAALRSQDLDDGAGRRVERRQISQAEIDARRETDARSSPLAPRPPALVEEEIVSDDVQDPDTDTPLEPPHKGLVALADAVLAAIEAQERLAAARLELEAAVERAQAAKVVWDEARAAVDAQYRTLDDPPTAIAESPPESTPEPAGEDPAFVAPEVAAEIEAQIDAAYAEAAASVALDGETQVVEPHPDLSRLTSHERRVLAATIVSQGDRKTVAAELGLTAAINVEMALESIGRKGLLPMDLIPLLPARFAKYRGV